MTTSLGLDASSELTRHARAIKLRGFAFAIRYYSHNAAKNLSLGEARALSSVGLDIGSVWESRATHPQFFNHPQGLADGAAAFLKAHQMGQPTDSAIYFAVDYDASDVDIKTHIAPYFAAVRKAIELAAAGGPGYLTGVYGSGLCCRLLREQKLADMSWLSQSIHFRESLHYATERSYNLIQRLPMEIKLEDGATLSIDPNETNGLEPAGLWRL